MQEGAGGRLAPGAVPGGPGTDGAPSPSAKGAGTGARGEGARVGPMGENRLFGGGWCEKGLAALRRHLSGAIRGWEVGVYILRWLVQAGARHRAPSSQSPPCPYSHPHTCSRFMQAMRPLMRASSEPSPPPPPPPPPPPKPWNVPGSSASDIGPSPCCCCWDWLCGFRVSGGGQEAASRAKAMQDSIRW